ncbi:MAG: carboxypeptidase-like regulatory domain-containing protein [Candidatus Zixiibacteriota bacterium]
MKRYIGNGLQILFLITALLFILSGCEKKTTNSYNSPPVIESISYSPVSVNPGGDFEISAVISDPDGDSLSVHWSTWENAGWFWNPYITATTVIVNKKLSPGMKLLTALTVSDNEFTVVDSQWITLIDGVNIMGHAYYTNTRIPIRGVEITIRRRTDTTNIQGEYLLEHIQPGERIITSIKTNCDDFEDTLTVDSTESHEMIYDIYLDCPANTKIVSGNISSFDNIDLENVKVTILNNDMTPTNLMATTDIAGNFSIPNVPIGNRILKIEDGDSVVNPILGDTLDFELESDLSIDIHARIKRIIYNSDGIDENSEWLLIGWTADNANDCYHFNSCISGGFSIMTMINGVNIPDQIGAILYNIDAEVTSASLTITYYVDDLSTNYGDEFRNLSGHVIIEEFVKVPNLDPSNKNLKLELWGMSVNNNCADIRINNISIFYYQ